MVIKRILTACRGIAVTPTMQSRGFDTKEVDMGSEESSSDGSTRSQGPQLTLDKTLRRRSSGTIKLLARRTVAAVALTEIMPA